MTPAVGPQQLKRQALHSSHTTDGVSIHLDWHVQPDTQLPALLVTGADQSGMSNSPWCPVKRQSGVVQSRLTTPKYILFLTLPRGFQCTNQNGNTCIAVVRVGDSPKTVDTALCSGLEMVSRGPATFPDIIVTTSPATTTSGGAKPAATATITREITLRAPMFQLNFQSTDLVVSPAPSSPLSSSDNSSNRSSNVPPNGGVQNVDVEAGPSTATIAGAAIGAALGGAIITAVIAWLFIKKRRDKDRVDLETRRDHNESSLSDAKEWGNWQVEDGRPIEVEGSASRPPVEVEARAMRYSYRRPAELAGS